MLKANLGPWSQDTDQPCGTAYLQIVCSLVLEPKRQSEELYPATGQDRNPVTVYSVYSNPQEEPHTEKNLKVDT